MVDWPDVIDAIQRWYPVAKSAAEVLQPGLRQLVPVGHVALYVHPETQKCAAWLSEPTDLPEVEELLEKVGHDCLFPTVTLEDIQREPWVKVATASPFVRRVGELLNILPGHILPGIPNAASPLAALLTSGLVGAGLGAGGGYLAKQILPEEYGENLPYSGALLGGLAGASLPAVWGAHNLAAGKSLLDPYPFRSQTDPGGPPLSTEEFIAPFEGKSMALPTLPPGSKPKTQPAKSLLTWWFGKGGEMLQKTGSAFGQVAPIAPPTPFDVHIGSMGQTLWQSGAPPDLSSAAMGTLYAASQMPSPRQVPGYVTGEQLGSLAMNLAGDYVTGYAAGKALNMIVGTPYSAPMFGAGAATLGLVGAVLPKILGG